MAKYSAARSTAGMASKRASATATANATTIVRLLETAIARRRLPAGSCLSWFDNCGGEPSVEVDDSVVAEFAAANWRAVRSLLSRRNLCLRQAAFWALATTRRPEVVEPMLALLLDQRGNFDHDYSYGGAMRLGAKVVRPLGMVALAARGLRRTFAIECLGMTRAGRPAVSFLRRLVAKHGFVPGVLNALYNVDHADVVPIAAAALAEKDPEQRLGALSAMGSGLHEGFRPRSKRQRQQLTGAVLEAMADARTWRSNADPWASLLFFGLEVLEALDGAAAAQFAQHCLDEGAHAENREDLLRLVAKGSRARRSRR